MLLSKATYIAFKLHISLVHALPSIGTHYRYKLCSVKRLSIVSETKIIIKNEEIDPYYYRGWHLKIRHWLNVVHHS